MGASSDLASSSCTGCHRAGLCRIRGALTGGEATLSIPARQMVPRQYQWGNTSVWGEEGVILMRESLRCGDPELDLYIFENTWRGPRNAAKILSWYIFYCLYTILGAWPWSGVNLVLMWGIKRLETKKIHEKLQKTHFLRINTSRWVF